MKKTRQASAAKPKSQRAQVTGRDHDQLVRKAYLLCEPENGRVLAVVPTKKKLGIAKDDPGLITKQCKDTPFALAWLGLSIEENGGKINLSTPCKYKGAAMVGQFSAEYRLEIFYADDKRLPIIDSLRFWTGSDVDKIVTRFNSVAKCIVRNYEYTIYASKEIPVDEIRNSEMFTRNLEDSTFRDKYGIYCITEMYTRDPIVNDYGILFVDISKLRSAFGME